MRVSALASLDARDDEHIVDLLAIRLAWECLLDDGSRGSGTIHATWMTAWRVAPMQLASAPNRARIDWLWQRALEIAYQQPLAATLTQPAATSASATPDVQAVFCIDVRSEVFRRALEAVSPQVQTLGFAGFFGLLIAYTPLGTDASRPQLPGLLSPTLSATDVCDDPDQRLALIRLRQRTLAEKRRWFGFQSLPGSMFTFVESLGVFYLGKLLRRSLPARAPASSPDKAGLPLQQALKLQPRLASASPDAALAQAALAEHVLRAMNLTQGFARLVLLVGHGSQSTNNPHAAGLDCGACCGQTGEVNARALAALLNDTSVRQGLSSAGIAIPESTHFLAALHNTTTDEVELFETDLVPQTHTADLDCLRQALATAGARVRCERAPTLGLAHIANHPEQLLRAIKARANDWAQVRPEWGLANNAAFIVAPRARTRGRDLAGLLPARLQLAHRLRRHSA